MRAFKTFLTNRTLSTPRMWKLEQHGVTFELPVYDKNGILASYWKPTFKERVKILFGANFRISLVTDKHPPIEFGLVSRSIKEVKA